MSTLAVNQITTQTGDTISLASGKTFHAPGHLIQYATAISTAVLDTQSSSYADLPGMTISFTPKNLRFL